MKLYLSESMPTTVSWIGRLIGYLQNE